MYVRHRLRTRVEVPSRRRAAVDDDLWCLFKAKKFRQALDYETYLLQLDVYLRVLAGATLRVPSPGGAQHTDPTLPRHPSSTTTKTEGGPYTGGA